MKFLQGKILLQLDGEEQQKKKALIICKSWVKTSLKISCVRGFMEKPIETWREHKFVPQEKKDILIPAMETRVALLLE